MRTHLLKYLTASVALLSGLAVLAFSAPVALAAETAHRGSQRGGLVAGTTGSGVIALALVALALLVGGLTWAIVSDRRRQATARSSSEPQQLPGTRGVDKPDETRKAA